MTLSSPLRSSGNWYDLLPTDAVDENGETVGRGSSNLWRVVYSTEDGHTTSVAHWLEEDDFRNNGGVMNHEMVDVISKRQKPFTVDYTGLVGVLIKNSVFENEQMKYRLVHFLRWVFESGNIPGHVW